MKSAAPGDSGIKQVGTWFLFSAPRLAQSPLIRLMILACRCAFTSR